jgi:predicted nucleotidyltransferase component of viral defense system
MITLSEIKENYPPKLRTFELGILREYIQFKILELIYSSKFNHKLVFMGGTALRIVYENQRFSEDLDFDNLGLEPKGFEQLIKLIKKGLELEGFKVETRIVYSGAFHCYIKIPGVLYKEGLSNFPKQKIVIRIDTTSQDYNYNKELHLLDKFDVYQNVNVVPINLLMSQKVVALLARKRAKGRDFFDVSYLISKGIKLDMTYISEKLTIQDTSTLRERLLKRAEEVDLELLAENTEKFIFNSNQTTRITNFPQQVRSFF